MKNIIFLAATLFSITTLPAQAPPTSSISDFAKVDANTMAHMLTQSALSVLIGVVVMLSVLWFIFIVQSYTEMGKSIKRNQASTILFVSLTLGALGSGCSAEQRLRVAEFRAAQAAEYKPCPMNQHHSDPSNSGYNYRSPHNSYSAWYGTFVCKRCGKRIFSTRF
jgi:hypothetical protein